jgi:hypothetical protein
MHYSINPEEIEIEKLGQTDTNIWNIKQYGTKLTLSVFFVDLKPDPNNKDVFNVEYIQQCKIKFELPEHKRDIAVCANCQRYWHIKNYYHLKPRCVKFAGDHLTNLCHRKERCVLCGGNHTILFCSILGHISSFRQSMAYWTPVQDCFSSELFNFTEILPS